VTGKHVKFKNAHILPASTNKKVLDRLQLPLEFKNDVNASHSNFIIFDERLEEAFDAMKISFTPHDRLHTEILRLKIWDNSCRDDPVGEGNEADKAEDLRAHRRVLTTIGDYENAELKLPKIWLVSKRALSYHTLCCYMYPPFPLKLMDVSVRTLYFFFSCNKE